MHALMYFFNRLTYTEHYWQAKFSPMYLAGVVITVIE